MSKGNMLLGNARGSVGDVTFQVLGGQQIAKKKSTQPKNPRTVSQMMQRAVFASAVQFFSRGQQNFFQFAFENKDAKLSDYNAFMSINAKMGVPMSPEMLSNPLCPAIGKFQMSKGSLTAPETSINDAAAITTIGLALGAGTKSYTTVGELSADLVGVSGYAAGDIMTLVYIESQAKVGTPTNPIDLSAVEYPASWNIKQFIIKTDDDTALEDLGISAAAIAGVVTLTLEGISTTGAAAVCCVHSRNTQNGLKVSSTLLTLNAIAEGILALGQAPEWTEQANPALWKASQLAILQGGASFKSAPVAGGFTPSAPWHVVITESYADAVTAATFEGLTESYLKALKVRVKDNKSGSTTDFTLKSGDFPTDFARFEGITYGGPTNIDFMKDGNVKVSCQGTADLEISLA